MKFVEKLDILMSERNLNRHSLSSEIDTPYTTIDGWFKRGCDGVKMTTLIRIADYFGVSLDYLIRENVTDRSFGNNLTASTLRPDESRLLSAYQKLNADGKKTATNVLESIAANPAMTKDTASAPTASSS